MRLLTLTLAMLALSAAPASALDMNAAQVPFPSIGQRALTAATTYWGSNPCPDGVRQLPTTYAELGASMAAGGCVIFWDPTNAPTTPLEWCTRVIHEVAHLLGYSHNDDPWSPMYHGGRMLVLSGPFRAHSSSEGFCYGHGFYRTWKPRGVLAG